MINTYNKGESTPCGTKQYVSWEVIIAELKAAGHLNMFDGEYVSGIQLHETGLVFGYDTTK